MSYQPMPKYGPPAPATGTVPEGLSMEDLADLYWKARSLPGETTITRTGIHHGPKSAQIWHAMKV